MQHKKMEQEYFQIEDDKTLIRDSYSKGIINNDTESLKKAKERKLLFLEKKNQIDAQLNKINSLETRIEKLESLLQHILSK